MLCSKISLEFHLIAVKCENYEREAWDRREKFEKNSFSHKSLTISSSMRASDSRHLVGNLRDTQKMCFSSKQLHSATCTNAELLIYAL